MPEQTQNKLMPSWSSRAMRHFTCVCLHAQTAVHAGNICTWRIMIILIYGENLKTPKSSPMLGSRWHRFWDLWCIFVVTLLIEIIWGIKFCALSGFWNMYIYRSCKIFSGFRGGGHQNFPHQKETKQKLPLWHLEIHFTP